MIRPVARVPLPLTTERLLVRAMSEDDVAALHADVYGDPEVMRWVGDGPLASVEQSRELVRRYVRTQEERGWSFWAVVDRASGVVIGDAGLWPLDDRGPQVELGYTLARAWWGLGLATEAAEAVAAAAFADLRLDEIFALVDAQNPASARVLEKLGMTRVGPHTAYGRPHWRYRLRAADQPSPARR
jgi:RimJ/RimL family protein N-acetyltransferase